MYATSVIWETYKELRTLEISDPTIPDAALAGQRFRLGQAASWARWGDTRDDLRPITARSEAQFRHLGPLTTAIIFLGLNWGGTQAPRETKDWQNFHATGHAGDLRLSTSLPPALQGIPRAPGTPAPAPYMTDVFKLVPTRNGTALQRQLAADAAVHNHVARCAALLEAELALCTRSNGGTPPLLVALGAHAYGWLTGVKRRSGPITQAVAEGCGGRRPRIVRINHASAARPNAERTRQLAAAIEDNVELFM